MAASLKCTLTRTHTHTSTSFLSVTKSNACNESSALSACSYVLSVCLLRLVNSLALTQLTCCIAFPSGHMPFVCVRTQIQNLIFLLCPTSRFQHPPLRPTKSIWPRLIIVTKAVQRNMHILTVRQIRSQQGGMPHAAPPSPLLRQLVAYTEGAFDNKLVELNCGWCLTAAAFRMWKAIQGKILP